MKPTATAAHQVQKSIWFKVKWSVGKNSFLHLTSDCRLWIRLSVTVAATMLQSWEPIIVPALRSFPYKRPFSANRSRSGPQRNSTACRLPPLSVSVPFSTVAFFTTLDFCMTKFMLCGFLALVWRKSSERTEWVRGRCHQSTLPRLFFIPTTGSGTAAGGYPYRQDLILVPSNCECLVTVGGGLDVDGGGPHNDDDNNDADEWNRPGSPTNINAGSSTTL